MPTRPQIKLSKEELDKAEIPTNHILVRMTRKTEGITTKAGIVIGFLEDDTFAEGDDSHTANLAEVYGIVEKLPERLYFNPDDYNNSMDWDVDMELCEGDAVWFSILESKNSNEILCDGITYKIIPYQDVYCYKREIYVDKWSVPPKKKIVSGCVNGYVLCSPVYKTKLSKLDHFSERDIDMTKGVIKVIGEPPRAYIHKGYSYIPDLKVNDIVVFDPKTPLFFLERLTSLAKFDGNNKYWVVQSRRISMVLNS